LAFIFPLFPHKVTLCTNRDNGFVLCQSGLRKFAKLNPEVHRLLSSTGGQKKPA